MNKTLLKLSLKSLAIGLIALTVIHTGFIRPLETDAQVLPTNVNVTDLTDSQVNTYYAGVSGLSGDSLLAALNQIIDGHREYSYDSDSDRTAYKIMDRNWTLSPLSSAQLSNFDYVNDMPYIRKFYADYNDSAATADLFKNPGASRVSFDKEHLWAQSLGNFGRIGGAGSDFHSLVPSDVKGNQQLHSNYNFAIPTSGITSYVNDYGTYVGRNGYISGYSQKVMEPLDEYKGDIARAMFYMPARYYTYEDVLHPKLTLVNGSPSAVTASPSQAGLAGDLETLLEWNLLDPVDEYEIHRNNLIYNNYQLNRNPFIDHPEWATIAFDTSYSGPGATIAAETSSVGSNPAWEGDAAPLLSISVDTSLAKTSYFEGEALDTSGLVVTATYEDGSRVVSSYSTDPVSGSIISGTGSQTITISYTELGITKTTSYSISVTASTKTLLSISLNTSSVQSTFKFQEDFNNDGLVVTANFDEGAPETIINYAISTPNMDKIGTQTITVTYLGKTATYDITITNQGARVGVLYATDLIISEYVEGTSNNKYLEIYNGTNQSIDLSDYELRCYSNADTIPTFTSALSGTLAHNTAKVYRNSNAVLTLPNGVTATLAAAINFNGNDSIELYKISTSSTIDVFGKIGDNPDPAWTAANGVTTVNKTLVRNSSVISGDTNGNDAFDPSLEWTMFNVDTATYLGSHTMDFALSTNYIDQAISYASFFLDLTGPFCEVLNGSGVDWSYLTNEYDFMDNLTKDYFVAETTTDETILAAQTRYRYLIGRYSSLASSKFIEDSSGVLLNVNVFVEQPAQVSSHVPYAPIIIIGTILVALYGVLFVSRKRKII